MKKIIAVIVIFVCVGAALSAQVGISIGGGAILDASIGNGIKRTASTTDYWDITSTSMNNTSIGAFVFLDATYVEADVYFAYGFLKDKYDIKLPSGGKIPAQYDDYKLRAMQLGFSILGKYPIQVSSQMTAFPLIGMSYNMVLSLEDEDGNEFNDDLEDLNQFGILVGGGFDYSINSNVFIRVEGLLHFRLPNQAQKDMEKPIEKDYRTTLGIGPQIKLAVGYRF